MANTYDVLVKHRANLAEANSFEEYKAAHLAYVDMLIVRAEAIRNAESAAQRWVEIPAHSSER